MQYKSNDRLFIAGMTGSGKTYIMRETIFSKLNRVILHDRKWRLNGLKATYCHTINDVIWAWNHNRRKLIYQPRDPSIEDFDSLCHIIFWHGNCVLIVDEIGAYTSAKKIPLWYSELLRLGRERNNGVVTLSQRPIDIHNTIISESDYILAFILQLEGDRKKVAGTVGDEAMKLNSIPRYHYLLYSAYEGCSWHRPI